MEASLSAGDDTHDYSQSLQAAWRHVAAHDPSLEAQASVHATSQANLTQIKDAIKANSGIISNPPIFPIDPQLLQSDGTAPFTTPFTKTTTLGARKITDFNGVRDYHVQNPGSVSFRAGNTWPTPPAHDQSFPPSLAIGGQVSTAISDDSSGRAQDMGIVSRGAKRSIPSNDSEGQPPTKQRVADSRSKTHSSPRISDLNEHHLELLNLLPDNVIVAELQNPYNLQWTTEHHVSDKQVQDVFAVFRPKTRFDQLFHKDVLRVGDMFRVQTGYVRDAYLVVHSMERDQTSYSYPCMQFLEDPIASPTDSVVCKGPREVIKAVEQHYDAFKGLNRRTPWDIVYLIRDGVELGTIGDIRERYILWNMQVALWASKNNVIVGRRRINKKEGSYPTFPAVMFK